MGILGRIFGTDKAIEKGFDLVDNAFYTDQEEAQDAKEMFASKAKHRLELLQAYTPFKVAQRYIAVVFLFNFTISFLLCLVMAYFEADTKKVLEVISTFQIGYIMLTIVIFYFGGGFIESKNRIQNKDGK